VHSKMRFPGGFSGRTGEGSHLVEGICLKGYMPALTPNATRPWCEEGGEGRSETPVDLDVKSVSEKLRRFLRTAVVSAITGRFVRA
jgi:hypothetical protein